MEFWTLIILLILSTVQSIFGIGLLVIGTPIFLFWITLLQMRFQFITNFNYN